MGLGGFIIGGALAGAGKAMQLQQEDDIVARREARLEALRASERAETREWQKEDQKFEVEATANRDLRLDKLGQAKENRTFARETELASAEAAAAAKAKAEEEQRIYRVETFRSKLDIAKSAADKKIEAAIARGEIRDIITDDEGNVTAVYGDGKGRRVEGARGKVTQPKETANGDLPLIKQAGGAPKPKATTPPATSGGGMLTDAQAEAFANNPANKGKSFIGPDGKRYTVQ